MTEETVKFQELVEQFTKYYEGVPIQKETKKGEKRMRKLLRRLSKNHD